MKLQRSLVIIAVGLIVLSLPTMCLLAQTQNAPDADRSKAETQKLIAEKNKLDAEAAYFHKAPWISFFQNTVGFLAILIPVTIGLRQLREQRISQVERARVDASLKAAEIAMDAPTSGQVRSRSQLLSLLLKDLVPDFGKQLATLDLNKMGFASYRTRFTTLLEAIASHPDKALLLTETYNTLFPDDDANSGGRISSLLANLRKAQG